MNQLLLPAVLPPTTPKLDPHHQLTPQRLTTTSMLMTDVDDRGRRRMKSRAIALVMAVTFMATLVLDVSAAAQTATSSRGEALWSWSSSSDSADGQELSDSMESSPSSENEFLLQLSSDANWTSYVNETDDDQDDQDDDDEREVEDDQQVADDIEDAVIFDGGEADDDDGGINGTHNWWTSPVYPSGYTPLGLVIASIFVTFIMIIIVGGNILVIIAIATERSLKGIQNWFIGSLAVADCLLGLIIMPFSLANEMMGYWVFGQWWCDVHSAVDVLLCTSSIMNLCLISLDRYWSITHAIEYLRKRTPERCVIMITTVWILSGLVSIPPLLGWKKETPQGEFPKCQLSEDIGYVLYSALGSFYIPSCIMVFVYIRIYYAARARARRSQENKIKRKLSQTKEQQLEQQQQRRLSKAKGEMQQQQQQQQQQPKEELEMKPIKVAVLAGITDAVGKDHHHHPTQQTVMANNNGSAQGDRSLPALLAPSSRGSLTNIKPLPAGHHITADIRRHSLSIGDVGLKSLTTNWGPSLSVDRLSVFDGCRTTHNKPTRNGFKMSDQPAFRPSPSNGRKASNVPSAAPSLTAINESSSTGDDQCHKPPHPQPTEGESVAQPPAAQRPSSLKNGSERTTAAAALGTKHCVTFECLSVESSSVTYSTVRCFSGDQQPPPPPQPPFLNNKVAGVEPEPTATICEQQQQSAAPLAVQPAVSKRTPLLGQKPRSRFEKLARRILATGLAEGSAPAVETKMNSSSTYEWSSVTNDDDHHLETPSPINASDHVMITETMATASGGKTCASAAASAAGNHKTLRSSGSHDLNNENDMASDGGLDPSSSDSGTLARCTVVRPLKIRFCRPNSGSVHKKSSKAKRQVIDTGRVVVREKDPARERRRISRQREKRATLILGLIMGAFIACWLPFFFLYLLAPVCPSCNIQPWGFAFAFWLGYINSALNPVIYTIFNKDFRRAFRRILFRCTIAHY